MHELSFLNWKENWLFSTLCTTSWQVPFPPSHLAVPINVPRQCSPLSISSKNPDGVSPNPLGFSCLYPEDKNLLSNSLLCCQGFVKKKLLQHLGRPKGNSVTESSPSLAVSPDLHLLVASSPLPHWRQLLPVCRVTPACGFPQFSFPCDYQPSAHSFFPLVTAFPFLLGSFSTSSQPLWLEMSLSSSCRARHVTHAWPIRAF